MAERLSLSHLPCQMAQQSNPRHHQAMRLTDPIPPATADKLATEFPKGTRHKAKLDIAVPLIGNGLPASAVIATLREKFPEASESEITDVVDWVVKKHPEPSRGLVGYQPKPSLTLNRSIVVRTPIEQADWWVSGIRVEPETIQNTSPIRIPKSNIECAQLAIGSLYKESENINVVCKFTLDQENDKARPYGQGKTLSRDQWVAYFQSNGVPQSEAGAWMRINPCAPVGTGKDKAMTDADVSAYRYVLVESDVLPLPLQLALFSRIKLPIAAIILSGSASAHAWVKVEAQTAGDFKEIAGKLFALLKSFGIDQANSNPSRLCRLPGATRQIGAKEDGIQRLLWLNPSIPALTDEALKKLEESLKFPAIEEKPLRAIAGAAYQRWEELYNNQGKLGVPFGIPVLDFVSGGMKPGQTVVIAGASGGGKTTFGIHLVNSALDAGYGVALFSLEMDKEEIFDQIVSNRCSIDRNKFNNGKFNKDFDFPAMSRELPKFAQLPLYIEDGALVGVEDIRLRVMQLKADNRIHLVVVDYIQFVNPTLSKDSREQQVAAISHGLRALARECRLPFVVLSQLNDEGKLRESRVIAHNANIVMLVEVDGNGDNVAIKVVKGRGIPCSEYRMEFVRRFCRLIPLDSVPNE